MRQELWNESSRAEVGEAVGRKVALPIWITAAMVGFSLFGPVGLASIGALYVFNSTSHTDPKADDG